MCLEVLSAISIWKTFVWGKKIFREGGKKNSVSLWMKWVLLKGGNRGMLQRQNHCMAIKKQTSIENLFQARKNMKLDGKGLCSMPHHKIWLIDYIPWPIRLLKTDSSTILEPLHVVSRAIVWGWRSVGKAGNGPVFTLKPFKFAPSVETAKIWSTNTSAIGREN